MPCTYLKSASLDDGISGLRNVVDASRCFKDEKAGNTQGLLVDIRRSILRMNVTRAISPAYSFQLLKDFDPKKGLSGLSSTLIVSGLERWRRWIVVISF